MQYCQFCVLHPVFLCGSQHFLTAMGGLVAIPLILSKELCLQHDLLTQSHLISTIFFVSGICTLLQVLFGVRQVNCKKWDMQENLQMQFLCAQQPACCEVYLVLRVICYPQAISTHAKAYCSHCAQQVCRAASLFGFCISWYLMHLLLIRNLSCKR